TMEDNDCRAPPYFPGIQLRVSDRDAAFARRGEPLVLQRDNQCRFHGYIDLLPVARAITAMRMRLTRRLRWDQTTDSRPLPRSPRTAIRPCPDTSSTNLAHRGLSS